MKCDHRIPFFIIFVLVSSRLRIDLFFVLRPVLGELKYRAIAAFYHKTEEKAMKKGKKKTYIISGRNTCVSENLIL
jgi:hypothetical protein